MTPHTNLINDQTKIDIKVLMLVSNAFIDGPRLYVEARTLIQAGSLTLEPGLLERRIYRVECSQK